LGSRGGTWGGKPTLVQTELIISQDDSRNREKNAPKKWESTDHSFQRTWVHAPADAWFLCFGADLCQGQWGQKRHEKSGVASLPSRTKTALCLHRRGKAKPQEESDPLETLLKGQDSIELEGARGNWLAQPAQHTSPLESIPGLSHLGPA